MPSNKTHRYIAKQVFGLEDEVSGILDEASKTLGPRHRIVNHTLDQASKTLMLKGKFSANNLKLAALHIATDKAFDKLPSKTRKLMNQLLETNSKR